MKKIKNDEKYILILLFIIFFSFIYYEPIKIFLYGESCICNKEEILWIEKCFSKNTIGINLILVFLLFVSTFIDYIRTDEFDMS